MPFIAQIDPPIQVGKKIVVPVSMSQVLEQGESFKSILEEIEKKGHKENTTILICDYLDRHNSGEEAAIQEGKLFLQNHETFLQGFVVKDWKKFIEERQDKFNQTLQKIEETSQPNSPFWNKIKKTHQKCLRSQSFENSLAYQQEEYAAILCMDEFDELIYPKKISDGMAYLYGHFEAKKPNYNHIKVTKIFEPQNIKSESLLKNLVFFKSENDTTSLPPRLNHMHIALRAELRHLEELLKSDEISEASKELFADAVQNLIQLTLHSKPHANKNATSNVPSLLQDC